MGGKMTAQTLQLVVHNFSLIVLSSHNVCGLCRCNHRLSFRSGWLRGF